ncbi:FkbM family methyltransferase [Acaryochloris sp. IP29b_bin.148]|uniref:FkbM family methyltransferase n=1 Tax=Acaryochloris sp. IP29b_bin.148 TaxID=2969218 RepID=UPI0026325B13|nr:FkbM family methyltransferase [Acaryochloris sp. IP29b_bin.148]
MKISTILHSASKYLQYPELLMLRRKGVTASQYSRYGQKWIKDLNLQAIFDIGANVGQSAIAFHALFPSAQIYSFEPVPDCFETLKARTRGISNIHAFNTALGTIVGEMEFERNEFPACSSFLPLSKSHITLFNYAVQTNTIKVQVDTLDNFASQCTLPSPIMLKIDVQGFEEKVLRGGESLVRRSSVLIIETSFKALYEGQPLFKDIYSILQSWGFEYAGSVENLQDPITGVILQSDSIFRKL